MVVSKMILVTDDVFKGIVSYHGSLESILNNAIMTYDPL